MARNFRGGKKTKRSKTSHYRKLRNIQDISKDMSCDTLMYGKISKACGSRRFEVQCKVPHRDEIRRYVCKLNGSIKKLIKPDDYVLVDILGLGRDSGRIIEYYTPDEIRSLKREKLWDYPEESGEKDTVVFGQNDEEVQSVEEEEHETEVEEEKEEEEDDIDFI